MNTRFERNIFSLVRANILAQVIAFASLPLLTRLFTPDDFGLLAVFSSSTTLLAAFSTGRVEWSLPNARLGDQARSLVFAGFLCASMIAIGILIFGRQGLNLIADHWPNYAMVSPFSPFLGLSVLLVSSRQILEASHIRTAHLGSIGIGKVLQSTINLLVCLLAGLFLASAFGLITAYIIGILSSVILLAKTAPREMLSVRRLSLRKVRASLARFWPEMLYSSMASTLNRLSQTAFPVLLLIHFPSLQVGLFALTQRLALTPTALLTNAISQSFWAEAADIVKTNPERVRSLYLSMTLKLVLLALAVVCVLFIASHYIDIILGKSKWTGSGAVLRAILPMLAGQIAISPLSHLIVHGKQKWQFGWDLARTCLLTGILIILPSYAFSFVGTLIFVSVTSLILYVILFFMNLHVYRMKQIPSSS